MFSKQHAAALSAEFFGTGVLALTVVVLAYSQIPTFFIAMAAGLALAIMVFTIGRISGAHINPAVTFGLWTIKEVSSVRAFTYIVAQLLGGLSALLLFSYFIGQESISFQQKDFIPEALVAEVVGTAIFAFGIAAAVAGKLTDGARAFTIGASLTLGILVASIASSAFLNPAVMLAAQTLSIADSLGPVIGAVIGLNLYVMIFSAAQPAVKKSVAAKPVAAKTVATTKEKAIEKSTPANKTKKTTAKK